MKNLPNDWCLEIHRRLLAEDPVAPAELVERTLDPLFRTLQRQNPRAGQEDLQDAVVDALMDYVKRPKQFDPDRRGLFGFLVMAAQGDLRNALAKGGRRTAHETSLDDVELDPPDGKDDLEAMLSRLEAEDLLENLDEHFDNPTDRKVLRLICEGERSTSEFARVLDLEGLPAAEQRREVKRHKDRIKKRLERSQGDIGGH